MIFKTLTNILSNITSLFKISSSAKEDTSVGKSRNSFGITLINMNTSARLDFNTNPDDIKDIYSANFAEREVIGRSSPVISYVGGSKNDISFSLTLHEDLLPAFKGKDKTLQEFIRILRSMSYPMYSGGVKAPLVYCKLGNMVSFWGNLNTDVTYKPPVRDGRYIVADVTFSFTKIGDVVKMNGDKIVSWDINIPESK